MYSVYTLILIHECFVHVLSINIDLPKSMYSFSTRNQSTLLFPLLVQQYEKTGEKAGKMSLLSSIFTSEAWGPMVSKSATRHLQIGSICPCFDSILSHQQ